MNRSRELPPRTPPSGAGKYGVHVSRTSDRLSESRAGSTQEAVPRHSDAKVEDSPTTYLEAALGRMIAVLASRLDPEASWLVDAWRHADAALLSDGTGSMGVSKQQFA